MPLNSEIVSILIYFLSVQWSRHRNPGYGQEETCSKLSLKKFEVLYQTSHFTAEIKFNILFTVGFIVEVITYPPGGPHLLTLEIKGLDSDFNSECFYKLIGSPYIQYDICSETLVSMVHQGFVDIQPTRSKMQICSPVNHVTCQFKTPQVLGNSSAHILGCGIRGTLEHQREVYTPTFKLSYAKIIDFTSCESNRVYMNAGIGVSTVKVLGYWSEGH